MRFFVSRIYREGNTCADELANIGLSLMSSDFFGLIVSLISLGWSTLGIGWKYLISGFAPFEKVLV